MSSDGFIPLSVPVLDGNEWDYVKECLDTNWLSSAGAFVDRFERAMAHQAGTEHAIATVNGTAALHVALLAAGVRPGDKVLTSTLTFIAPANAIRYAGAEPVFVDADKATWQMDPGLVRDYFANGGKAAAILPVHILGHPVDLDPLLEIGTEFGVPVIEDATESLGATYKNAPIGSFGKLSCFSFNGNKLITSGGGGMVCTNDAALATRIRHLTTQAKSDSAEYIHDEVGFNYRLTNIQAAVGLAQLERLDAKIKARRNVAKRYEALLNGIKGISLMPCAPWAGSVFWLSSLLVDNGDSRALRDALKEQKIEARPLWQPLHLSPAHKGAMALGGSVAEGLFKRALCLPSSCDLSESDQNRVVHVIKRFFA